MGRKPKDGAFRQRFDIAYPSLVPWGKQPRGRGYKAKSHEKVPY